MSLVNKYKLLLLFIFAFLIRLIHLDQSLWLDEGTTAMTIQTYSIFQIITQFSPADFHPPLYYIFMDLWIVAFGYSEISLRMPSVLFSLGAGWFIYRSVLKMRNDKLEMRNREAVAFWATAFFLLNPLIVYYSQEARMYAMVTFFVTWNFYYLQKISRKRIYNDIALFNLSVILMFMTFYASVFYIAAVLLYLLYRRMYHEFFSATSVFLVGLTILAPLLLTQYSSSRVALTQVSNWSMVLGNVSFKNMALIPMKFTSGRISFEPKLLYYFLSAAWMGLVFLVVTIQLWGDTLKNLRVKRLQIDNSWIDSKIVKMFVYFFVFPLILGTIFSIVTPLLQFFRFQYLIVFLSILLGYIVCHSQIRSGDKNRFLVPHWLVGLVLSTGFTAWSLVYLVNPQFHREDWKSLAKQLRQEQAPVHMIMSSSDPLRYYAPEIEVHDLKSMNMDSRLGVEMTENIIIVPYTADIHGVDYRTDLADQGYVQTKSYSSRELSYEVWER